MGFFDKIGFSAPSARQEAPRAEEVESQKEQVGSSVAWKKFMALFLAGALSVEAVSAATNSMTPEEKLDATEFMKKSPEQVKQLEAKILEMASTRPMKEDGMVDGIKKGHKNLQIEKDLMARVDYENDAAVSIAIRDGDTEGARKIIVDGGDGQKIDGRIDKVKILDKDATVVKSYSFTETVNAEGQVVVELTGVSLDPGQASTVFYKAQQAFNEGLNSVVNPPEASR